MAEEIKVPDIGSVQAKVIEVLVKEGDQVQSDDPLITLEGDKATMDVPSPHAGTVTTLNIKVGDTVAQGSLILLMETAETKEASALPVPTPVKETPAPKVINEEKPVVLEKITDVHAGPGVRRLAHELGVSLAHIVGSGAKQRITKEDLLQYVRGSSAVVALPSASAIDFSKFGETERVSLNRIKKLTGVNLHRNWATIPHVTQFGEADITELEAFRVQKNCEFAEAGVKLTPLIFIMKAVVAVLQQYPQFNSSLDPSGDELIYKKYFHLGVAVDTPNGLVVPVIRDVNTKNLLALSQELALISAKARDKGLSPTEMQGSCFTISSLGGIGGTAFTPIINAPDVAILGVSKALMKPVYQNGGFIPRLLLPLSLSYDHRVIDGADGARFIVALAEKLSDIRSLLL